LTSAKEDVGIAEAINFILKLILKTNNRNKLASSGNPLDSPVIQVNNQAEKKSKCCDK
jgi:hypothetical protein